jgi:hypothetical protein
VGTAAGTVAEVGAGVEGEGVAAGRVEFRFDVVGAGCEAAAEFMEGFVWLGVLAKGAAVAAWEEGGVCCGGGCCE